MARLRSGRAHTVRGAAHFLRETVGRVRAGGASGQLTMRADSGFYAQAVVAVCGKLDIRFSITIRQQPSVRRLVEAIPEGSVDADRLLAAGRRRCRRDDLHALPGRAREQAGTADRDGA